MTDRKLTWSNAGAGILALVGMVFGVPFAVLGFGWEFAKASFETGQAFAELLSEWMRKQ